MKLFKFLVKEYPGDLSCLHVITFKADNVQEAYYLVTQEHPAALMVSHIEAKAA